MEKRVVVTDKAPSPGGPYSQAVIAGDFVFVAGQVGIEPQRGQLVPGGIEAQTRQTLNNISAILEAAGSSLKQVVKTTVYLAHIEDFAAMNAAYKKFFPSQPPARATVGAGSLPAKALVEIDVVALRG